ncbi:MAG: sulfatase-like hydrolase/transferase [Pirellula sp.]
MKPGNLLSILVVWFAISPFLALADTTKPNIIFILADDLGIANVGCYGSDHFKTPNIDALAASGIRFTKGFTAPLCGPSRALIMSGRYAFRTGATNQDACRVLPMDELHLARIFKDAGYTTAAIGKWGQLPGEPSDAGFDDVLRFKGSGVYWNSNPAKPIQYTINGKEKTLGKTQYMPDLMHEHAVKFIRQHQSDPFFLYYSLSHVHGVIQPTPDSIPDSKDLFGDNVAYMDKLVGKLVQDIDAMHLRERTLIIFMGDNGSANISNARSTIGGRNLSGMKGSMLEGGGLVPLIVSWRGTVPSGKVSDDLIDSTDFLPTFAELIGTSLPKDTIFDGHSFAPQLHGLDGSPREWVFNQLARMWYARDCNFKLTQDGKLYDMSDAPFSETLVEPGTESEQALASRAKLKSVLAALNPSEGILDQGDGTGRHANRSKSKSEND